MRNGHQSQAHRKVPVFSRFSDKELAQLDDGHCFVGEEDWEAGITTKVHLDPSLEYSVVTSGVLNGTALIPRVDWDNDDDFAAFEPEPVVMAWFGRTDAAVVGRVTTKIRVSPQSEPGGYEGDPLVRRLTELPDVKLVVVSSDTVSYTHLTLPTKA